MPQEIILSPIVFSLYDRLSHDDCVISNYTNDTVLAGQSSGSRCKRSVVLSLSLTRCHIIFDHQSKWKRESKNMVHKNVTQRKMRT